MLHAFSPQPIHEFKPKDKSKIECLFAYGDRLLVGLSIGSLRIYRINESQATPTDASETDGKSHLNGGASQQSPSKAKAVELLREEEKFSRRPVQQLAIVKEASLLVSLSDGYISLHDLQTYQLSERVEKTKGASVFAVTSNVVKDADTGVPSLVSRLAVGVKRRLLLWTWRDMELETSMDEPVELTAEATVKSLNWVHGQDGKVKLVMGMDPGFTILDLETQEQVPVYKPASRQDKDTGELAGIRFGAVSSSGMGYMGMGSWVPKPMASGLSDGQVLLAKDVNTLFCDLDGKPLEKRQVPWHLAPEAVGYSYPYLLALQPPEKGTLQIRNPDTLTLLQTIPVATANHLHVPQPNISLAHAGKGFLVASDRTIWRMNALPYDTQLGELIERERFDEAISLLRLLEDTLINDKLGRIREVKTQKAINFFQQQKYRPALDLFTEAEAPPERVIALYPKSIAGDLSSLAEPEVEEDTQTAEEPVSDDAHAPAKEAPSTPQKGYLSKFRGSHARNDSDAASIRSTPSKATAMPAAAAPEKDKSLEGEDLKFATRCLCSFLAQTRVQIQKYLTTGGTLKISPPELDAETQKPAFANLLPQSVFDTSKGKDQQSIDWQHHLLETAKLVDTTLFRAYMLALPSLAGPLFRLDNFCDPDVVQESLYANERYGDLIDFLHGKRRHRQALQILSKFGKGEDDEEHAVPEDLKGPQRTVQYLKQLPPELVDLVLEFVAWPLEAEPEKGMEVFTADTDNAEKLPRERIVRFLGELDSVLEAQYLEHIINELGDQTADFHQRLVDLYLSSLKNAEQGDKKKQAQQKKLETFLRKSKAYNKVATFRQLPQDDATFYESRAIVLSVMGNHKQALAIYVFQLQDFEKAEQYCNETYLQQQAQQQECLIDPLSPHEHEKAAFEQYASGPLEDRPNVFALLLGLYLRPPSGEEKRWPQALDLLSKHGSRLPASSTLELMPDDLAVADLHSYFVGRIRNATSVMRQTAIVKSLSAVHKTNVERKWMFGTEEEEESGKKGGRSRRVRITEDDHCRVCHKRFGASAIRVYPDNTVVHYGCVGKRPADVAVGGTRSSGHRGWS